MSRGYPGRFPGGPGRLREAIGSVREQGVFRGCSLGFPGVSREEKVAKFKEFPGKPSLNAGLTPREPRYLPYSPGVPPWNPREFTRPREGRGSGGDPEWGRVGECGERGGGQARVPGIPRVFPVEPPMGIPDDSGGLLGDSGGIPGEGFPSPCLPGDDRGLPGGRKPGIAIAGLFNIFT